MPHSPVPPAGGFKAGQRCEPFPSDMGGGGEFAGNPLLLTVMPHHLGAGQGRGAVLNM